MTKRGIILLAAAAVCVGMTFCAEAEPKTVKTATTTPATSRPTTAATKPEADPKARAVLDRLAAAGEKYTTLRADVEYKVDSRLTGDTETRTGRVAYQKKTPDQPSKFRVSFETLRLGQGRRTKELVDYIFDGAWLIIAKHRQKTLTRIQVAAKGEKVEPLKIGKGPFPMPFGQKADEVVKYLEVTTRKPHKDDPKNTEYLKLVPRRDHKKSVNFARMEMWIDRKTHLPVRLRSKDHNKNITTVDFRKIQTHTKIDPKLFTMKTSPGWKVNIERLKGPSSE
jgi:hypothetical protein